MIYTRAIPVVAGNPKTAPLIRINRGAIPTYVWKRQTENPSRMFSRSILACARELSDTMADRFLIGAIPACARKL